MDEPVKTSEFAPAAARSSRGRMHKLINHLIQLQDLAFARDQQEASLQSARLAPLDASIRTLVDELPVDVRSHYEKMRKKGQLAIVPISKGACAGCGMVIPVSQVHAVHGGDILYRCPACARFLHYPESLPRRITKRKLRSEPAQVGVARFSAVELMVPKLAAKTRDEALGELSLLMQAAGFVDNGGSLLEEALRREAIASTTVDYGLAFPHVRGVEGGGVTLALGLSRKGIRFEPESRTLTRIIFFIVIPTAASAFYLRLLSGLTQTFREESAREALMAAETPDQLWKTLNKLTRSSIA